MVAIRFGGYRNRLIDRAGISENRERWLCWLTLFLKNAWTAFSNSRQLWRQALSAAGIDYRIVGGLAVYLYVEEADPDAGRLTRDIDIAVRREDLERIAAAVKPFGLEYRHAGGVDMLLDKEAPSARRAVHLVFAGEKVRPEYEVPAPELAGSRSVRGVRLIPLPDLIRMKLTSFRAKDEAHLKTWTRRD